MLFIEVSNSFMHLSLPTPKDDVMKESAQISLNWVRANAAQVPMLSEECYELSPVLASYSHSFASLLQSLSPPLLSPQYGIT